VNVGLSPTEYMKGLRKRNASQIYEGVTKSFRTGGL
jgi:hypothetical protein